MKWLSGLLLLCSFTAVADEKISICYNYGCIAQAEIVYSDQQLRELSLLLASAHDAAQERAVLGAAVGRLLGWAGEQSPIKADRGGNYADDGVNGRMDCIDHSMTTTRLLRLIERRGGLRYHRVLERVLRRRFLIFEHYSAQIEEVMPAKVGELPARYVVDSWFFDNGQPAAVMPLARWLAGEGPNVDD
jgi:hypothetical protein